MNPLDVDIEQSKKDGYLSGQILIAMPQLKDSFFARAIVYVCAHNETGAMGIILNKALPSLTFKELFLQLGIEGGATPDLEDRLHFGGPVETTRGFVLHSPDHRRPDTIQMDQDVCLTTTVDIIADLAHGKGPKDKFVALGYAGWGAGQLDEEIRSNGWLNVEPDRALLYAPKLEKKWETAIEKIGINLETLSGDAGQA